MPAKKGWRPPFNQERHEKSGQYRLWQAMRMHRRFTYRDLAVLEIGTLATIKTYCNALLRAGYLRSEGKPGGPLTYTLVRNTGPLAPQIRRHGKTVEDLNQPPRRTPRPLDPAASAEATAGGAP